MVGRSGLQKPGRGERANSLYLFRTLRAEVPALTFFFLTGLGSIAFHYFVSEKSSWSKVLILKGRIFSTAETTYFLHLPLLTLIPAVILAGILIRVYDVLYVIDSRSVEAKIGLASFHFRQPRLRLEDIRGVEPRQNLWERLLGVGTVLVGSAMSEGVEIVMEGIDNPQAVLERINEAIDARLAEMGRGRIESPSV